MKTIAYRWWLLALLAMAFFFNQTDRVLFGLLTTPIQSELGLTDIQIGAINTALFATIACVTPLAGPLGDRFSRKMIITLSVIGWSAMTIVTGFAGGFAALMFFRSIAAGVGEACYMPSALPLIAAHHRETRTVALSIHQSTLYVGLIASGSLVGALFALFGENWRALFWLFGGLGLVLGVAFIWLLRDGAEECKAEGEARESVWHGIKVFFSCPSAVLIMCGAIAIVAVNNAYLSWAPKFVMSKYGLSVGAAGTGTMMWHHAFAMVAIFASSLLADRFSIRHPRFRLGLQVAALVAGAPAIAFFGFAPAASSASSPAARWVRPSASRSACSSAL